MMGTDTSVAGPGDERQPQGGEGADVGQDGPDGGDAVAVHDRHVGRDRAGGDGQMADQPDEQQEAVASAAREGQARSNERDEAHHCSGFWGMRPKKIAHFCAFVNVLGCRG